MITDKIHYELSNALNLRIWLEGEDLNKDEQLNVQFRMISNEYIATLSFCNMTDGVDFDSLNEISTYVQRHKERLILLHK